MGNKLKQAVPDTYGILRKYLCFDFLDSSTGVSVLVGYVFEKSYSTGEFNQFIFTGSSQKHLVDLTQAIGDLWNNSNHPASIHTKIKHEGGMRIEHPCYSPEYVIDWALSKRFRPDWLDWAIEQKLYTPKELRNLPAPAQNTPAAPEFDKANPTYPPELAYALEAWRAVSATEGKGKPKARIKAWLDTNTKLSDKAKERIAVVANWEKLGGATSTE